MKTKGMAHQLEALRRMNGRRAFALFMEMGTGKTWTFLADAERAYAAGKIDALFVLAPKGVHTNWVRREIPTHMSEPYVAFAYSSGPMSKRRKRELDALFAPRGVGEPAPLRILTMNIDAISTPVGEALAREFLSSTRAMFVLDESIRIKNPDSGRTKRVLKLAPKAVARRIGSGAPITNAPLDVFSQMEFLESGLLGTTSYRAFVAEYAELLPPGHGLVRHITDRLKQKGRGFIPDPQIVATDENGNPKWRNLDRLQALLAPHSFRVRKSECLDLPPKIYQTRDFALTPAQRRVYDALAETLRIELGAHLDADAALGAPEQDPLTVSALAALSKLRQVTSGFVIVDGVPRLLPAEDNPRMKVFGELVEEIDGKFIVWAHFVEEIQQLSAKLRAAGIECVEYHGAVPDKAREAAVDAFQSGTARVFLGQPQSGGIGLTLTAASTVVYYSNDFNFDTRVQSEDRAHRIGTRGAVVYIDLVAENTKDEDIARALRRKSATAALVLGDGAPRSDFLDTTLPRTGASGG